MQKYSRKIGLMLAVLVGSVVGFAGAAGATTPVDPTNGAYATGVAEVQSFVTDTAAGPLFLLAAAVVGIMVGLRWLKKSRTAAS